MNVKNLIQQMGGPVKASVFFECTSAAISQWIRENKIPNARLLHLKAAKPELFDAEQDEQAA